MNKVVLIGRLTANPGLKFAQGTGNAVCTFTIAVNRRFKKEGYPEADFIPIVVFGKQAEATATYMIKGSQLSISGNIQTRNYEAKDGTKKYVTEVVADEVVFLDSKGKGESSGQNSSNNGSNDFRGSSDITPVDDGDIPF
ncbi:single-stranded DNA-binding protein [Clostridium tagluense]|uniref:single-stranded DNA-binding protein n=1 Tax=Clostridium tagluense TaxID=360422 RepID=UPI001C6EE8F8|nr:single-stranded DNA-binding protein [Clostridium tagluense]MBW9158893.1 single-stranded DNA-binding protein [Clostridium tagluense]WLC67130.1 single-stranded DNA-binding protein [Clostridium tagluense]